MATGRPVTFDREAARDALMRHFHAHGFSASSSRELQDASGLSPSSLYRSFGSKEKLFVECLRHYTDLLVCSLNTMISESATADDFFFRLFNETAAQAGTPSARLGCLVFNSVAELGKGSGSAAAEARRSLERIQALFAQALFLPGAPGQADAEQDADQLVVAMIGLRVLLRTGITRDRAESIVTQLMVRHFPGHSIRT